MAIETLELENEAPTRGESLADQVYHKLGAAILSGTFAPNERITIRRLAEEWNMSVTPAREAVLRLISEEILQLTDRNAVVVPTRSESEIQEIFEIRRGIEGSLAAKAAPLLDANDLAFLVRTQEAFLHTLKERDYKEALRCNARFHFRIYRRPSLPLHLKLVEGLWLRIGPTLRNMYPILQGHPDRRRRHDDIIDCVRARDPEGLKAAVIADLDTSEIALYRFIAQVSREARRPVARRSR
jgi:DNA-binding GntR family transcriptional regulator